MKMMAYRIISALSILLLLSGCGGGDSGNSDSNLGLSNGNSYDDFSNAKLLTDSTVSFFNSYDDTSSEEGEPGGDDTVWYKWVAPHTGNVSFWMVASACCTGLNIYTGNNVANLTKVASGFFSSTDHFYAEAGVTYYFQFTSASHKNIRFFLNAVKPVQDNYSDRQVMVGSSGTINNLTLLNAGFEETEQYHGPNYVPSGNRIHDGSIWFTWTALETGLLNLNLEKIYDDAPAHRAQIYEGDSMASMVLLDDESYGVTAGTTYQIQLTSISRARILNNTDRYQNQEPDWGAQYNLHWNMVTGGPVNDFFSQATLINGDTGTAANQTLTKATNEVGETTSSYSSIWYEWTAGFTGQVRFDAQGILSNQEYAYPVHMHVYTGVDVSSLAEVASDTSSNSVTANVETGVTYKLRIGSVNDCSRRADGGYCTTQASSITPVGGIDDFDVAWQRL